ncbi:uncharacterized protein LOC102805576, partial [Saccoglossus kowalevskii]|uniref:Cytochrome P450 734A1-like n=1 Tax=Saccoglossus kowalevskii TaxID=10224 RepID=A0ABM0M8B4_SACKO
TFTQLMGNGLLSSSGNEHTSQRKLINPAFNHTSIKGMLGYFQKYSKELRHYWQDYINKNRTEDVGEVVCGVQVDLGRATLDVIGETAFGYKFNAILEPNKEITKTFSAILQGALTGSSWKRLIPFYQHLPTKENQAIKKAIGLVKKTVLEVIEHRRNEIKDGK